MADGHEGEDCFSPLPDREAIEIDTSVAHPARGYDYGLGGHRAGQLPGDRAPSQRCAGRTGRRAGPPVHERVGAKQTRRTRKQVAAFFEGLELVEPGLVQQHRWRPDPGEDVSCYEVSGWGAVGRKP